MSMAFDAPIKRFQIIPSFMQQNGLTTFLEVGCKEGRLTAAVAKSLPFATVWTIDPWRPQPQAVGETYEDWDFTRIEAQFWDNVSGHNGRVTHLRRTSEQAAEYARELTEQQAWPKELRNGFDLIFIDAAHDEASVTQDIGLWYPFVKAGKFIMGHDYQHKFPGVMRAVAASFPLISVGLMPDSIWMVQKP